MNPIINIYNQDCLIAMKDMKDNSYDLAIIDPNYGINQGGQNNHTRSMLAISKNYKGFDDSKSPSIEYFNELLRISKNQIIWGANHFISKIPFSSSCWIVWNKENGLNDFADCELAYTSFKTAIRIFKFKWQGMLQENMKDKEIRINPCQKPVQLYKWLLTNYATKGDKILDTHFGSGSHGIACWDLGFDLDAFELDKDYYNASIERLEKHKQQLFLFRD